MTTLSIIAPKAYGLTFMEWGSLVAELLAAYGVAAPLSEADWQSWVCALFYIPEVTAKNIPYADQFISWQPWADNFATAME